MNRNLSVHPCLMSKSSISQYLEYFSESFPNEMDELIEYCFNKLNRLSGLIKSHPFIYKYVQKTQFYCIKNMFVYFMYTLCTPYDITPDYPYKVSKKNIYHKSPYPTYELAFTINGKTYDITTQDSDIFAPGYLAAYFKDFEANLDSDNLPENDYSNISNYDVYIEYQEFIQWCTEHKWFFTMFYDENAVFTLLKKIYSNSNYYIHLDPESPSILKIFSRPNCYIYRYNTERNQIEFVKTNIKNIRDFIDFSDSEWQLWNMHPLIGNKTVLQNYSLYTSKAYYLGEKPTTIYNHLPKLVAQAIRNILNNQNRKHNDDTRYYISNK